MPPFPAIPNIEALLNAVLFPLYKKLPLPFELLKRGVASKCFVFFKEYRAGRYRR